MKRIKFRCIKSHDKIRHYTFTYGYESPVVAKELYKRFCRVCHYASNITPAQTSGVNTDIVKYPKTSSNQADKVLTKIVRPQVEFLEETWKIICR